MDLWVCKNRGKNNLYLLVFLTWESVGRWQNAAYAYNK